MAIRIQHQHLPDNIRIALIDMDGTATRCTDALNFEATREVFATYGVQIDEAIYSLARGRSREEGIKRIVTKCHREELLPEIPAMAEAKNREANLLRERLKPADIPDEDRSVLRKLRECGLLLALGTTSRNGLDTLNRVRLTSQFDAIITGNEAAEKTQIWQLAFDYLDAQPEEALVIEDAQAGIDAAVGLGVEFSVGIGSEQLQATVNAPRLGDLDVLHDS